MPTNEPFRILSLDGGGTWSLIQAKALLNLYPDDPPGHELLSRFDLVAANSGGSIVAGALASGKRLSEIISLYTPEQLQRIFVALPWWEQVPRLLGLGPRFSTPAKLAGLQALFGDSARLDLATIHERIRASFGKAPHFVITAFNYDRARIALFRSNVASVAASGAAPVRATLAEAVHASSDAPVNYFNLPAQVSGRRFWDGGISGTNNPVLVAVIEALAAGIARETIIALSIGTGSVFLPLDGGDPPLVQELDQPGLLGDIKKVASSILDDPPDTATFMAHVALGGMVPGQGGQPVTQTRVIRMSPLVQPVGQRGAWRVPDGLTLGDFKDLVEMDLAVVDDAPIRLIDKFCDAWMDSAANRPPDPRANPVPNQPVRINGDTLACEIGHRRFSAARAAWPP
jgi:predicted acylesterase/phospholipase RssA